MTVDELGNILREARETKGLALADAHRETRITLRFLEALEQGRYHELPSPAHVRGFLRNYARFLDLDPRPLIERYEQTKTAPPPLQPPSSRTMPAAFNEPLPVRDDQPFFDPVNVELSPMNSGRESSSALRLLIIAAFVVTIGLVAYRLLPQVLGEPDPSGSIRDALNGLVAVEVTPEATNSLVVSGEAAGDTSRNPTVNLDVPEEAVEITIPTPTPTRPSLPAVLDRISLRLDVVERSWVRITVDGEVQFQGMAVNGDTFEFQAIDNVEVAVGNGIGVLVTINETELGRLGGRGEAVTETWRVNSGG